MHFIIPIFIFLFINCGGEKSEGIVAVENNWEYAVADPNHSYSDSLDLEFQHLDSDELGRLHNLLPKKIGYIWLKKNFEWSESTLSSSHKSISIGRLAWADETYLNGQLIGRSGHFPPKSWSAWNTIREYSVPDKGLVIGRNEILVKLYVDNEGFAYDETLIGDSDTLGSKLFVKKFINSYVNAYVAFLFLIISLYHLLIFLKRKKDIDNYYYAAFAFLYALYCTNFFSEFLAPYLDISYLNFQKFIFIVQAGMVYFLARFFSVFFKINTPNWLRFAYLAVLSLSTIAGLLMPDYGYLHSYRGLIGLLQFLPALVFLIYSIIYGLMKKIPEAKAMVYGCIPLFAVVVHDISLVVFGSQGSIFLAGLGLPLFLGSIMFILAGKFVAVQNETDELNATLEAKVEERTAEVTQKMEEVQALKITQDGDYFLTSLINKPLSTNFNKSKLVSTSILLNQKKKFSFRKKNAELGGDLCITGNLRFGDGKDRWVVFFNADAMGKSMQGAGGSIVAGTAMNNIIGRSARNDRVLKISPEQWVAETYKELDSIFQTFNGSMLISCVLGVLNERTGEMFYFNAEHPWTAVYRDGRASFIENELELRKLGSESEFDFSVKRHQLLSGDVLFAGSDGRDDINLGAIGARELNEDETLFLRLIEESQGDLENLNQLIEFQGELTDDLSVIRVGFQEEYNPIELEDSVEEFSIAKAKESIQAGNRTQAKFILDKIWDENKNDISVLKLLIKVLFDDKKYGDTIDRINEFHKINKETDLFWFEKSVCYKQLQDYESAKLSGEVCRKFQPNRIANLINLADCYRMLGEEEQARNLLHTALKIEPENESALRLSRLLSSSGIN
ncbi:MAG: SpoIIE family protein phosphatase [Leptospira sp.]|nr:SpoIIE family protein phosphatase [Leptospira sp.]